MLVVVVHHIGGGDEAGHISAGFARQIGVNRPEVFPLLAGTSHGFVHVAGAAVVGGDGERPVFVDFVELAEIAGCGFGGAHRVAAFVNECVDLQAEAACGREHNLPQAGGAGTRHGVGVERRFDYGEIFQFDGEPFAFERFLEDRHVVEAHAEHAFHKAALFAGVHVDVGAHNRVEGELHDRGDGFQALYQLFVGGGYVGSRVNILVEGGVGLQIPVLHHLVGVGFHTFGKHNGGVVHVVGDRED